MWLGLPVGGLVRVTVYNNNSIVVVHMLQMVGGLVHEVRHYLNAAQTVIFRALNSSRY